MWVECDSCDGEGKIYNDMEDDYEPCEKCGGKSEVEIYYGWANCCYTCGSTSYHMGEDWCKGLWCDLHDFETNEVKVCDDYIRRTGGDHLWNNGAAAA